MVVTEAVVPAVYIGCIICAVLVLVFFSFIILLFLCCCCFVIFIWYCLRSEWVVVVWFGRESQHLYLPDIFVCCGLPGFSVVQIHLGQIILVSDVFQVCVGCFISHFIFWCSRYMLPYCMSMTFCSLFSIQWSLLWSLSMFGLLMIWRSIFLLCLQKY